MCEPCKDAPDDELPECPEREQSRESAMPKVECNHPRMKAGVFDQTLGVWCPDCSFSAACWDPEHVSEQHWNQACANEDGFVPCSESRPDVCAICDEVLS